MTTIPIRIHFAMFYLTDCNSFFDFIDIFHSIKIFDMFEIDEIDEDDFDGSGSFKLVSFQTTIPGLKTFEI